jgi:light-regulated signal transduction histidine kinase (bacteriophytochrome)
VEESVTKVFDEDEQVTKFIFIESDVSERKNSEKQMSEYLRNLESTNKELDKFAYVVSHDLKAPLRAIGNLTGWIEEDAGHMLPDMVRKNFNLIKNRVIRMESLINGILDYSKASKSENQYENVDLNELVFNSFDLLGKPEDCEIKIDQELPVIFTDRSKTSQVVLNLISNAVKFNEGKNKVIEVHCTDESDHYKIGITDNGPGIDPKFHEKIFKIFQTLNTRDEFESSGVGLAIVKKILDEEGGKIWLESEVGNGTTFYFTLPKATIEIIQTTQHNRA